jgi:hypothetical protein
VHAHRAVVALWLAAGAFVCADAAAKETSVDRTAMRFVTAETGGSSRPRYVTERELAFFARTEAMMEQVSLGAAEYPERYVRLAMDRLIARAMLASLMIQRGTEPPNLPRLSQELREELANRVGGAAALDGAMRKEGIDDAELEVYLRDEVRAMYYVDRGITPILSITEDALREAHRATPNPFRSMKFEDARAQLKRWVVVERLRAAELEFIQGARARIRVSVPIYGPPSGTAPE